MSSEQTKTSKESRAKKWLRRLRGGSPSPAAQASAPSTPQSIASAGPVPLASSSSSLAAQHTESEVSSQFDEGSTGNDQKPVPGPSGFDVAKDYLSVTGSFLQLVLKKVPDAVDSNPVKVVFSLAKAVLELKEGMDDNTNNVKKRIFEASELLGTVEDALNSYEEAGLGDETRPLEAFRREVGTEMDKLLEIRNQSRLRSFAVQEEDEQKIVDIFDSMDSARKRLMLSTTARIHEIVASLKSEFDPLLRQHLKASAKAGHDYSPTGEEKGLLRSSCTRGTRVNLCEGITVWATDPADDRSVYWLSGQGGSGKTTIACTIARQLESTTTTTTTKGRAQLGGSFFCSHSSPETRYPAAVVRTLVHQLATKCKAFKVALKECGFDAVDKGPRTQLEALLVNPWKMSALGRLAKNEPCYVITIDALDELEGEGGIEFLGALFEVINQHKLKGLKFFITSRSEPELVKQIEAFSDQMKRSYRLEEVPVKETSADIELYFREHLTECATDEDIQQLVEDSDGLFIYAATVVEHLKGRTPKEKKALLQSLITLSLPNSRRPSRATAKLDTLYLHVLETRLIDPRDREDPDVVGQCLSILHTILCTFERTSTSLVADLLDAAKGSDDLAFETLTVDPDAVLNRLHAVLYVKDGRVGWFHKSFPDFMFDEKRSSKFYCNPSRHHHLLATACFEVMKQQLRFNIANIGSSYELDSSNPGLSGVVSAEISDVLGYACQGWSVHLSQTDPQTGEPLVNALATFLQLQILFWIETMNLLKQRGQCERMLRESRNWVTLAKDSPTLLNDLADAAAFALHFSAHGAVLSTPHLYISSLATFPRRSNLVQRWKRRFPGIPSFTHAHGPAEGALLSSQMFGAVVNAVSTDGTHMVFGSTDNLARLWDPATGELKVLEGHRDVVTSISLSPDHRRAASGSHDGSVRIWEMSTGELQHSLFCSLEYVRVMAVAWSPDGKRVISGATDRVIRVWDASTGEQLKTFEGHEWPVYSVACTPGGTRVVSSSSDQTLRVWDAANGEQVRKFHAAKSDNGIVLSVACSPNSTCIAWGSTNALVGIVEIQKREHRFLRGHRKQVNSVAYSPDGKHIVSASHDKSVRVWDASTGQQLRIFEGHTKSVLSVAYTPDAARLISGGCDTSVRVWDLATTGEQAKIPEGHTEEVAGVAYSPDGKHIASGASDRTVRIWDASSGNELKVLKGHTRAVTAVAYSPDGTRIASGSDDASLSIWDTLRGEQLYVLKGHSEAVTSVAYSYRGEIVVSGSNDKTMRVWNTCTGDLIKVLQGHTDKVTALACSPVATLVASGSSDKTVRIWDMSSGEQLKVFADNAIMVVSVAWSPDGANIVSASLEGRIQLCDASSGKQLNVFRDHCWNMRSVAFSPDGRHVVTTSSDPTVRVWNVSTGQRTMELQGHADSTTTAMYSPDGTCVVSGSADASVRVWCLSTEHYHARYHREKNTQGAYTGWLVSPTDPSVNLMLVPLADSLLDDYNVLTMPTSRRSYVDFSSSKLGERWAECYEHHNHP